MLAVDRLKIILNWLILRVKWLNHEIKFLEKKARWNEVFSFELHCHRQGEWFDVYCKSYEQKSLAVFLGAIRVVKCVAVLQLCLELALVAATSR